MPTPPLLLPDAGPGGTVPRERGSPPDAHGRWLRELEKAHAALRAPAVSAAKANAGTPGHEVRIGRPAAAGPDAARATGAPRRPTTGGAAPASAPAALPRGVAAGAVAGVRSGPATSTAGLAPLEAARAPQAPPRTAAPRPAPVPHGAPWGKTNTHVLAQPQGAALWIRDARLGPASTARLLHELRARLRAAGWRMASLVVNGRRVDETRGEQVNPEHIHGGDDGD